MLTNAIPGATYDPEAFPFEIPQIVHSIALVGGISAAMLGILLFAAGKSRGTGAGRGIIVCLAGIALAFAPWVLAAFARGVTIFLSIPPDDGSSDRVPEESAPAPESGQSASPSEPGPMDLTGPLTVLLYAASAAIIVGLAYVVCRLVKAARLKRQQSKQTLAETAARWKAARDLHSEALSTVASYELDVAKAIDYPAFNDISVPEVSAMSKAMRRARDVGLHISQDSKIGGSDDLLDLYRDAVDELVTAVEVAEAEARKIRWQSITPEEQKLMRQAKQLLAQAEDPGNSEQARHTFYQRLKRTIDQLNESHGSTMVPAKTIGEIEEKTRPLLESHQMSDLQQVRT